MYARPRRHISRRRRALLYSCGGHMNSSSCHIGRKSVKSCLHGKLWQTKEATRHSNKRVRGKYVFGVSSK